MQCSCEREALMRVLTIGADLCRAFPDLFHVTFATCATALEIVLWHEGNGVGVRATLPAEVREAGSLTVPLRPMAEVLATHPGSHIDLASVQIPDPAPIVTDDQIPSLPGGPALQLDSRAPTGRRQRTRMRLSASQATLTGEEALTDGHRRGIALASLAPAALRTVWEPCLLLAKKRDEAGEDTPDMDHAQILFRLDPDALVCTATTRHAVAQACLSWARLEANMPVSHVLVDERRLHWITKALHQETQPVTLTLFPQADATALLLVALSQVTLICRVATAPIPLVWERRVPAPASQVMLLSRVLLARSLDLLAADRAHGSNRCLWLQVQGRHLRLQWDPLAQDDQVACELPLVNAVAARAPVLVHLRSLREMLRQFKEPVVCLEQGELRLRKRAEATEDPVPIGFVRLSQPASKNLQMMMTITRNVSSPSPVSEPGGPAPEFAEVDQKGEPRVAV